MTVALELFQVVAEGHRRSAALKLSPDGGVQARSGRVAQWIPGLRRSNNRTVARAFAESLRSRYGKEVAGAALREKRFERSEVAGRALRARTVRRVVDKAESVLIERHRRNEALLHRYGDPAMNLESDCLLRARIDKRAAARFPDNPAIGLHIDPQRTLALARAEIMAAGRGGIEQVAEGEADEMVTRAIDRQLDAARDTVRRGVEQLGVGCADSTFGRALAAAAEGSRMRIDSGGLTGDAVEALSRRLGSAIAAAGISVTTPGHDSALDRLARDVAAEFVDQRKSACRAFAAAAGDTGFSSTATDRIAHDSMRAPLAAAMGKLYPRLHRHSATLGKRLDGPQLRDALLKVAGGLEQAMEPAERDAAAFRQCLRVLLASPGCGPAASVCERLALDVSLLRAIAEGANWFSREFPDSGEAKRTYANTGSELDGQPIYPEHAFARAKLLSAILLALSEVAPEVSESNGAAPTLGKRGPDALPDEAIAVLRELAIPIPAPHRIGTRNDSVRLSGMALAEVQHRLTGQVERLGAGRIQSGVPLESLEGFRQCAFTIDGVPVPRGKRHALRALRALCTDARGRLNPDLLKNVSAIANKSTIRAVDSVGFDPRRPERAVAAGSATIVRHYGPGFDLKRGDRGDVVVEARQAAEIWNYLLHRSDGSVESVRTAPARSSLDVALRMRFDPASCMPTVEAARLGYALSPAEADGKVPELADAPPGVRLPASFDRAGAIARLDQEILWQREELHDLRNAKEKSPENIRRMQAELHARELCRTEFASGRDPRLALRATIEESGIRHGDDHHRTRAFLDTLDYFENCGAFAAGEAQARNVPTGIDTSPLLAEWHQQLHTLQGALGGFAPRSPADFERAEALADVEGFMQQAIMELSSRRDPRPELLRHADELERRRFGYAMDAADEAQMLKTMAREYGQLL